MPYSPERIAEILSKWPDTYDWKVVEVGPHFTVERRSDLHALKFEVIRHESRGLFSTMDEAISAITRWDTLVTIPQDISSRDLAKDK